MKLTTSRYDNLSQVVSIKREIKRKRYPLWKRKYIRHGWVLNQTVMYVCVCVFVLVSLLPVGICWTVCRGFELGSCAGCSDPPTSPQSVCLLDQNSAICSTSGSPPERNRTLIRRSEVLIKHYLWVRWSSEVRSAQRINGN